jgi:hypothetical protein
MKSSIEPTVGRMVLAILNPPDGSRDVFPAIVVRVFKSDNADDHYLVNVKVICDSANTGGTPFMELYSVPMVDPIANRDVLSADDWPANEWCEWMPFQQGQAAMTEKIATEAGLLPEDDDLVDDESDD